MGNKDDGTINLRVKDADDAEFQINHFESSVDEPVSKLSAVAVSEFDESAASPSDKVKVKFDKFVNLIATHAYDDVVDAHMNDDVIISTDLLTDLANAHEEKEDKKMPLVFLIGIFLGVMLTWFLLKS